MTKIWRVCTVFLLKFCLYVRGSLSKSSVNYDFVVLLILGIIILFNKLNQLTESIGLYALVLV